MALHQFDRFESVYSSRDAAIEKLDTTIFKYAQPVAIKYYNGNEEGVLFVLGTDSGEGNYEIIYDSLNPMGDVRPHIYSITKTDLKEDDITCINRALFGNTPSRADIVIISTVLNGTDNYGTTSYIYDETSNWKLLFEQSLNVSGFDGGTY